MSKCPANKILNPASGRCVLRSGKLGKILLGSKKSAPIPKPRKRRPIPPVRTTSKQKQKRLPNEMWMEISKHLTPAARINLSQTSTTQYGNTKRHRDMQRKQLLANWGPNHLKSQLKSFNLRADNVPDTLEQIVEQLSVNARVNNKYLMERVEREVKSGFRQHTRKEFVEYFKDSYFKNSLKGLSKLNIEKLRLMAARDDGAHVIIEERRKAQV